jgi:hypothetical protein
LSEAKNILKLSAGVVVFNIIYSLIAAFTLSMIWVDLPENKLQVEASVIFFAMVLVMAGLEELVFRMPLAVVIFFKMPKWVLIFTICGLSALFGYLHGSFVNIAVQGVAGVAYSGLFLLAGGLERKFARAYITCVLTHFSFNSILLAFILLVK